MSNFSSALKREGRKIGFVPTMGYLHEGHLSLIKRSKGENDITIVSIFVNPTQFAPNEDLNNYPKDFDRDESLLSAEGVDFIFYPTKEEIYPAGFETFVQLENVTKPLEGSSRPTHFKGVATVVTILFNIIHPDRSYFGQKDAQQTAVIKKMVNDLKLGVEIIICPIIRERDGLAMSSRNVYLSPGERNRSLIISRALFLINDLINTGEDDTFVLIKKGRELFKDDGVVILEYLTIVDAESFQEIEILKKDISYFVLIAAKVGNTRLIDNILIQKA